MKGAEVEMSSILTETSVPLRDVLGMKEGDVIPVEIPDLITLCAEEVPVFRGEFGVSSGAHAIKIVEPIKHRIDS